MHGLFVRLKGKRQTSVSADNRAIMLHRFPQQSLWCDAINSRASAAKSSSDGMSGTLIVSYINTLNGTTLGNKHPAMLQLRCNKAAQEKGRPKAPYDHVALQSGIHRVEELGIA